jgi:hypothetical protein
MTDEQPKALWLADMLEKGFRVDGPDSEAAAELRRLHALCDEMGEALQKHRGCVDERLSPEHAVWARKLDAALAKWKESK